MPVSGLKVESLHSDSVIVLEIFNLHKGDYACMRGSSLHPSLKDNTIFPIVHKMMSVE